MKRHIEIIKNYWLFRRVLETGREHEINDFAKYDENEQTIRHVECKAIRSTKDNRKSQTQLYMKPPLYQT